MVGTAIFLSIVSILLIWVVVRVHKIRQILSSDVVWVEGVDKRFPTNLVLDNYGVPLQVKDQGRVQVVFSRLTPNGDVEYLYSWHPISQIRLVNFKVKENRLLREVAIAIKKHLQIEPEVVALEEQHCQIDQLVALVASSGVYGSQVETYQRALLQIEQLLSKAQELQNIYVLFVREALIGVKVAGYELPNLQANMQLDLDMKYRQVREEYQQMKDTATAYTQLLKDSNTPKDNGSIG